MLRIVFRLVRAALVFAVIAALVRKAVKTPVMAGWERDAKAKWETKVKPRMDSWRKEENIDEEADRTP